MNATIVNSNLRLRLRRTIRLASCTEPGSFETVPSQNARTPINFTGRPVLLVALLTVIGVFPGAVPTSLQAQAPNIVWVSFHPADDMPSTDAAAAGFTLAPDIRYTDLLRNAGAQVTRFVTTATPDTNVLNAADLVIISRSIDSGNYQNAGASTWNTVTAPMIIMSGYTLRSSRMGFTTGTDMPDTAGTVSLTVNTPAHAIFTGIALDTGNTMLNPYAHLVEFNGVTQRGISVNNNPPGGAGVVLATVGTAGDPAFGGMVIGEWQAGDTLTHDGGAGTDVLGGHRLVFLSGSREQGITANGAGIFDLDPDGELLFINAVNYMSGANLVPPPRIVDLSPRNGTVFASASSGLSFTATSATDIPTNGIKIIVNDVDISGSLQFAGTPTALEVTYDGLESSRQYFVEITVTNTTGVRNVTATFDTFDADNPFLEAENFNFSFGQYINDPEISYTFPSTTSYYFQGYDTDSSGVDFLELDPLTRPVSGFEWRDGGFLILPQTSASGDFTREAYTNAFVSEFDLVNIEAGEWWNYTRDYSGASYGVYLRASASADQIVQLDKVTSDRSQSNQTTVLVGNFTVPSGGYGFVPLLGPNDDVVVLELTGVQTLRLTAPEADNDLELNYLMLVPTTNAATVIGPYVANLSPAPGATDAARDLVTATIVNRETSLNTSSVQLRIDGVLVSGLNVTPTATGADLSYTVSPPLGTSTTHTNELSYSDTLGNMFSRQWSFTTSADTEGPLLVFTAASSGSLTVRVYFDEPVNPVTATNLGNYSSSGSVTFTGAELLGDRVVELTSAATLPEGTVNTLTVSGVTDLFGNPIAVDSPITYNPSKFEQPPGGPIVIEAESYSTRTPGAVGSTWQDLNFEHLFPDGFVGGGAIYTDPSLNLGSPSPGDCTAGLPTHMTYRINFTQAGTYEIWIRGQIFSGGDSFHFGTNGVQLGGMTGINAGEGVWSWDNDVQGGTGQGTFVVDAPGEYTIDVWVREDGAILDRFAILPDAASPADYGFTENGAEPGPAQTPRTGDPIPPGVAIISPAAGAVFGAGADVVISATVTDPDSTTHTVEFFVDGVKAGEATTSPYSLTVSGLADGYYSLSATVTDPDSQTGASAAVPIQVGNPTPRVLFVVDDDANGAYNASDTAMMARMRGYGFEVIVGEDDSVGASDAILKELVMNSSTVDSGDVGAKFTTMDTPVFNWEEANEDDLLFTLNTTDTDRGALGGQTTANIVAAGHPMAAGLSGVVTIYDTPLEVSWGAPAASATVIATVESNAAQALIYGFETGALLVDGVTAAPARRVHFFLRDDTFVNLTPDGLALFEAALEWAVNRELTYVPPVEPQIGTINVMAGNLQFSGSGGSSSGTYHVLCTTNLALPLSSWTPVLTNVFDASGNFDATLPVGADPSQYYIILVP